MAVGAPLIRGKQVLGIGCPAVEPNALKRFTADTVVTSDTAYVESTLCQQVPTVQTAAASRRDSGFPTKYGAADHSLGS